MYGWQEQCKCGEIVMIVSWESQILVPRLGLHLPFCVTLHNHPFFQKRGYLIFYNETKQDKLSASFFVKNSMIFLGHQLIATSSVQELQYAQSAIKNNMKIINSDIIIRNITPSSLHNLCFLSGFFPCTL